MDEFKNTGQNLGIAALIISIITFVLAVIPCIGLIAIIPGIIAIVLASVGLSQAAGDNSPKGTMIAGLIIAVVATLISLSQVIVVGKIAHKAEKWPDGLHEIIREVQDNVTRDLKNANISIKIDTSGEKIEINTSINKKDLEKKLEDLESDKTQKNDTLHKGR